VAENQPGSARPDRGADRILNDTGLEEAKCSRDLDDNGGVAFYGDAPV
jgi:hypothetical protein